MRKIELSQVAGLLANIGVLIGIILLVVELRQNHTATQAQTRHLISQSLVESILLPVADGELAAIMIEPGCDPSVNCQSPEQFRYDQYWHAAFRQWENVHYQYRQGLYEAGEYEAQRENWRSILTVDRVVEVWEPMQTWFSEEFREELNGLISR